MRDIMGIGCDAMKEHGEMNEHGCSMAGRLHRWVVS